MRATRWLPVILFLLAAGGTAALGMRVVAAERAAAEGTARERLRVALKEAEVRLGAGAARLREELAAGRADAVLGPDGAVLLPAAPLPLRRLDPPRGRDPEADFYLAEGEQAEAAEGDAARAAALYRSAAAPGRHPESRAVALHRLAALARRGGDAPAVAALEEEFLAALPEDLGTCLEALLLRSARRPVDGALAADLAARLGADPEADGILEGMRSLAGIDPAVFRDRRRDLALREGIAALGLRVPPGPSGILLHPAPIRTSPLLWEPTWWMAAWSRGDDGTVRLRTGPPETLPEGVFRLEVGPPWGAMGGAARHLAPPPSDIRETLAPDIPGFAPNPAFPVHLAAAADPAAIAAAARRSARMLGGLLAALLLAGSSAFLLSLRAARRETEAARARADFVTRVGHDLRTPLAVVRMYAETLAAGRVADPAEAREFASVAAREAARLTDLVGQALDLSRVAAPGGPPARRPLDLAALAREVAALHRPLLERAGLRLEVRAPGPLPVVGDSASLRGALSNLLENAARHAASGGSVEVEAARDGTMAALRVLDRGPGVPPGMEERMFERFVRGPGAAGPGAGLGLALVREAAEAHGGAAAASGREGGGAVLVMRVPLAEEER